MSGFNKQPKRPITRNPGGVTGYDETQRTGGTRTSGNGRTGGNIGGSTGSTTTSATQDPTNMTDLGFLFNLLTNGSNGFANTETLQDALSRIFGLSNVDGANFGKILAMLGGATNDPLFLLMSLLGIGETKSVTNAQAADWNKQLLDTIIAQILEKDKRNYNEKQLAEQRLYDSPTNQLARLTGAGISRDAAIQLLGQGSEPVTTEGADAAAGVSPSQSLAAEADARSKTLNAAFSAISVIAGAIGSLGTFGMSAAALATNLAATKAATANTLLNNKQLEGTLNGIEVASKVIGSLSSYQNSGKELPDFESVQDMIKFINANATGYEPFSALKDSGALDAIPKDVYSLNALNDGYFAWRKTKDYNIDRQHIVRMQSLEQLQGAVDIELASSEIAANQQSINESISRVLNDAARLNNETRVANAQIGYITEQTDNLNLQNQILKVDADFYNAAASDLNFIRLSQVMLETAEWKQVADDPEKIKHLAETWLINKENARTAAALECLYLDQEFDEQTAMNTPGTPANNARKTALYFHNLFNFALGQPTDTKAPETFGQFAKSAAMMFLFRKPL